MPESAYSDHFKVGVFTLSAVVLGILAVIYFGAGRLLEKRVLMETYIDESVQGLDVGSPVKHRGVRVGSVESMGFVGDQYELDPLTSDSLRQSRYVLVQFALRPEVFSAMAGSATGSNLKLLIDAGLRVRLASQGLTGTAYLEADYLNPAANPPLDISWTPQSPYIPSATSIISRYSQSLGQVLSDLEETNIESVARNLDQLVISANRAIEAVEVAELREDFAELVAELRQTNQHVDQLVSSPAVPVAMENVGQASAELPDILSRLDRTVRRVDRLVATQEHNIEVTMDNLRVISTNFRAMSDSLRRYPGQLFFGQPPAPSQPDQP